MKHFLLAITFMTIILSPFRCPHWDTSRWLQNTGDVAEIVLPCVVTVIVLVKNDFPILPYWITAGMATILSVNFLKYTLPWKRPNGGKHSFPSGHTATAFVSAFFLWLRYGPRHGIPALLLASFVGYSRIYSHSHYLHDVLAGVFIGLFCAGTTEYVYSKWRSLFHGNRRNVPTKEEGGKKVL
ncbi:MAG: phosphatase PAP2 family protein [Puniceicoccales bacterium]|nr:phosphatase PAP2 family protein [Puniceicoccales bacterium]